ncbi:hypothetical protein [Streptomyces sp. NPDC051677]
MDRYDNVATFRSDEWSEPVATVEVTEPDLGPTPPPRRPRSRPAT